VKYRIKCFWGEIDRVTSQISELVETIKASRDKRDEETVRRLEKKEEQLRDEKKQLRDKEILLLKKEEQLRDKEILLLKERMKGEKRPGRKSPQEGNYVPSVFKI